LDTRSAGIEQVARALLKLGRLRVSCCNIGSAVVSLDRQSCDRSGFLIYEPNGVGRAVRAAVRFADALTARKPVRNWFFACAVGAAACEPAYVGAFDARDGELEREATQEVIAPS
jgi:hypothetical protein